MDNVFDYDSLIVNERVFGLEIIDGKVKVLEMKGSGNKYSVSGFGEADIDQKSIQDGIILNSEDVARALKEARENAQPKRIKRRFVNVMLPDSKIFIRVIRFPSKMGKDEIREAVEWKAKDLIAMPLDKVYWDWHRLGKKTGSNEMEVIISAVERECADSYTVTLKRLNLTPLYYDISGNAASRYLFQNKYSVKKALLVRIDQDSVTLSLFLNGGVRFQKIVKDVIKGGYGVLVEYAASQLRVNPQKAKKMILSEGKMNEEQKLLLKEFFEAKFDHWFGEIDQILDYYYQTDYSGSLTQNPVKSQQSEKLESASQEPEVKKEIKVKSVEEVESDIKEGDSKDVTKDSSVKTERQTEKKPQEKKVISKDKLEIYIYGLGAKVVYLDEFFSQKGLNIKMDLVSESVVSPIKKFISRQTLHGNLVILGLSLRNIGIFKEFRDINLVPRKIKSRYLQISVYSTLYQYLKIIFWNTYIIGVILVFAFLLTMVYKRGAEQELASVQNISESPANIKLRNKIIELNDTALQMDTLLQTQLDWDTFFEEISELREGGIVYDNLFLTEDETAWRAIAGEDAPIKKGSLYLVLSGTADTRSDLQVFSLNLQKSELFDGVRMPFSNFETKQNVDFTIYSNVIKENLKKKTDSTVSEEAF